MGAPPFLAQWQGYGLTPPKVHYSRPDAPPLRQLRPEQTTQNLSPPIRTSLFPSLCSSQSAIRAAGASGRRCRAGKPGAAQAPGGKRAVPIGEVLAAMRSLDEGRDSGSRLQ